MRAAKERIRMDRADREEPMPDLSHVTMPRHAAPLFVVSIRCRDGQRVTLPISETPHGLSISATLAAQKVFHVLSKYRPIAA